MSFSRDHLMYSLLDIELDKEYMRKMQAMHKKWPCMSLDECQNKVIESRPYLACVVRQFKPEDRDRRQLRANFCSLVSARQLRTNDSREDAYDAIVASDIKYKEFARGTEHDLSVLKTTPHKERSIAESVQTSSAIHIRNEPCYTYRTVTTTTTHTTTSATDATTKITRQKQVSNDRTYVFYNKKAGRWCTKIRR